MDNFDKKVQETLKQLAEGVNPSPQVEQRIHDEILSHILTEKNTHLF